MISVMILEAKISKVWAHLNVKDEMCAAVGRISLVASL